MSNTVDWRNPYRSRRGQWLKGALHVHTSPASRCGAVPLEQVLARYVKAGYDFLAVSDHNTVTPARHPALVLLPGCEWNNAAHGEHTGLYARDPRLLTPLLKLKDQRPLLRAAARRPILAILNHPNWQATPHYRREQLAAKSGFDGIEIYNHVIERLEGFALATDKWDFLLARGQRVLGFASDDSHSVDDIGCAWIMVRAAARTSAAIWHAMRSGNFYASSGVTITDIRRTGATLSLATRDAQEIQVIGRGGVQVRRVRARALTLDVTTLDTPYVRLTAFGRGSQMAWTQPFFLDRHDQA